MIARLDVEVDFVTKLGRNDPCSCGSGKKYKKCCGANELAAAAERMRAANEQQRKLQAELRAFAERRAAQPEPSPAVGWNSGRSCGDDLLELSNSVIFLLEEQRYDDALAVCDRLLRDHPDDHDGFERSARVHDALGNHVIAADFWQKAVDFVEHPDRRADYDEELIDDWRLRMHRARERAAPAAAVESAHGTERERAR